MKLHFAFIGTFILVGLVMWPQLQGMPLAAQLSQIASATLLHIQNLAHSVINFLQQYT